MNKTKPINSVILLLLLSQTALAQEYLQLNQDQVVYDVDVVVFARRLAQPSTDTYNNAPLVQAGLIRTLELWDQEMPLFIYPEPEVATEEASEEWQVPIEEQPKLVDVLSWVMLSNTMVHPIVDRLAVNPNFKPLMHQKWRQPATQFLQPEYVKLSQIESTESEDESQQSIEANEPMMTNMFPVETIHPDYSIDGQVAFSKQRFTHLHVKMNLFRVNADGEQIIHRIAQQKQVDLGEWQYFDHQQFGVLAKVTEVSLNPPTEQQE